MERDGNVKERMRMMEMEKKERECWKWEGNNEKDGNGKERMGKIMRQRMTEVQGERQRDVGLGGK